MLNINSARPRKETHSTNAPKSTVTDASTATLTNAPTPNLAGVLHRRAQALLNDNSIDAQTRILIRYALEINDPDLPDLIRRADNGESIIENVHTASSEEKIEALTDLICRAGEAPAAALLVLLLTLENSPHPKALANLAKHLAFTHCATLNLHDMVDAQIAMIEDKLFTFGTLPC